MWWWDVLIARAIRCHSTTLCFSVAMRSDLKGRISIILYDVWTGAFTNGNIATLTLTSSSSSLSLPSIVTVIKTYFFKQFILIKLKCTTITTDNSMPFGCSSRNVLSDNSHSYLQYVKEVVEQWE